MKKLPSPPFSRRRSRENDRGIFSRISARVNAHVPDFVELAGFACVSYAAWRFDVTLGILTIGATLVLIANQMGGSDGDDGPPPGA